MAQIRNTKIQDIYKTIELSKSFSINDFKIEFPDRGNILVKILFRGSGKYSLNIKEETTFLQTIEKPGNMKNIEVHNQDDIYDCMRRISLWLNNLDEDLKNEFTIENFENIKNIDEFEKKLNDNFPDENEKFTQKEKEDLKQKLNELQERIEKLEQYNEKKKQIEIIELSKIEIEKYPKKAWWLKFYNRFNSLNNGLNLINNVGENILKLLDKFGN